MKFAVLVTCFNRREKTLACLRSLSEAMENSGAAWRVSLCDDGSTDGTSEAVEALLKERVTIVRADGTKFWCGGMREAWFAINFDFTHLLLLNDDVIVNADAIKQVQDHESKADACIFVGATKDPVKNGTSYSGLHRGRWWNRLSLQKVTPNGNLNQCDTFNCNFVCIPKGVADRLGALDKRFVHAMGDLDYGLRARNSDIESYVLPHHIGTCESNLPSPRRKNRIAAFRDTLHPKKQPFFPWLTLCYRHAGVLWPFVCIAPYAKALLYR